MGLASQTYTLKVKAVPTSSKAKVSTHTVPDAIGISTQALQGYASTGAVFLAQGPDGSLVPMRVERIEGTTAILSLA